MALVEQDVPKIRGTVVHHAGLERSAETVADPTNIEVNLCVRVYIRDSHRQISEVDFHGRWALVLATLEPKDVLTIEGASQDDEGAWHVKTASSATVAILREDGSEKSEVTLDSTAIAAANVPEWLKLPTTRMVNRQYRYLRYMITLRDGVESNLFAVVLENAKPGPSQYGFNVGSNIVVVDRSFDYMPANRWSSQQELPYFSIQLAMPQISVEALPFLCVGDVIRCHRFRIAARPKRYLNIRQCKYSSVVVFPIEGSSPETAATLPYTPVTTGEHTVVDSDRAFARVLHKWIRGRLSQETLSDYLVDLCDLQKSAAHRDLVVKVLRVLPDAEVLVVTDGSTEKPVQVRAAEPVTASQWLFAHIKPGMWVKMRNVYPREDDSFVDTLEDADDCCLACNCSQVTLMPKWCFDVRRRARRLVDEASTVQDEDAQRSSSAQPEDAPNDNEAPRLRDEVADTVGDTDIDEQAQEDVAQPRSVSSAPAPSMPSRTAPIIALGPAMPPMSAPAGSAPLSQSSSSNTPPVGIVVGGKNSVPQEPLQTQPAEPSEVSEARGVSISLNESCPMTLNGSTVEEMSGDVNQVTSSETPLARGSRVVVCGLTKMPQLNGKTGTLLELVKNGTKWKVSVDGDQTYHMRVANVKAPPRTDAAALPLRMRLNTTVNGSQSFVRIPEIHAAFVKGERALVLGGFQVTSAEENLFAHCDICSARFPWEGGDEFAGKRKRYTLPCGHWLFDIVFEVKLELCDTIDRTKTETVCVRDESDAFFGISAKAAARDAANLQRVRTMLRALTNRTESNTMTVNLSTYPDLALLARYTRIEPVIS